MKRCDNKSVGMLVQRDGELLLIERRKFPFGFAPPAGHLDGDTYEGAAKRELQEEVGLETIKMKLVFTGRKENVCRREGGDWHDWEVFAVEAKGEVKRSKEETKQAFFCSVKRLKELIQRTRDYLVGKIPEGKWRENPGLEPVWYEMLASIQKEEGLKWKHSK